MKAGKNAAVIMALAAVFMMLVVPLSTGLGGGVRNLGIILDK